jgi:HSP20 family protein
MWTRWSSLSDFGLEQPFARLGELRREMDRLFFDFERGYDGQQAISHPRIHVSDTGSAYVFRAELPGFGEKDIELTVDDGTLTLSGERKDDAPERYAVHRKERSALKFSRSFQLPAKVEADKAEAALKDGVLTLTLPKAPEAQPKQITVKVS